MKYLKLVILLLVLCNLPSYSLAYLNPTVGSVLSYSIFLLLIIYYLLGERAKPIIPFIVFGLLFSFISLMVSSQLSERFLATFMKYFLFIITVSSMLKDVKKIEMYVILIMGSLSIIYEAIFITDIGGRYSGFYLNANIAAYVCILGYALGLSIENKTVKIVGQILFSIGGLVTFSRTFLLIWVLINLLSVFVSYKNVYKVIACVALFVIFLSFGDKFDLDTKRLDAFSDILGGKIDDNLKEGSRTETWALYYDKILDHPIWGNGYQTFSGETGGPEDDKYVIKIGVHNTFLMILGEAGILALLYFLWMYGYIVANGVRYFKENPSIFFVSFSLILYMLTNHNYFENYLILFTSLWLYHEMDMMKNLNRNENTILFKPKKNTEKLDKEYLIKQYHLN